MASSTRFRVVSVVFACLAVSHGAPLGMPAKRKNTWYVAVPDAASRVLTHAAELLHLSTPPLIFHADDNSAQRQLADALWGGDWISTIATRFSEANPALVYLLEAQRVDDSDTTTSFGALMGQSRWESVVSAIFRARSQKWISIETAALSVMFLHYRVPKPIWDTMRYFSAVVMCKTWTEPFVDMAVECDPGPAYPVLHSITAAVFDNLMMKVDYSAMMTGGMAGRKIEMTNWATVFMPASAMPSTFTSVAAILGAGGIFKPLMDMEAFIDTFSMFAPDIVAAQRTRWRKYMTLAAAKMNLWNDDPYDSPYPPTKFQYHDPIFDRPSPYPPQPPHLPLPNPYPTL